MKPVPFTMLLWLYALSAPSQAVPCASDSQTVSTGGQNYASSGSYSYDLSDNLQGGLNGWAHNSNDQVTSAPAVGGLPGATGITYDNSGNLLTANGMTLTWDAWGRLTGVTGGPGGNVTFAYDALGRRVSKTSGGVTTYYLYDGSLLVAEVDAAGSVLKSYTWGALGLVSDRSGAQSRFYLFDAQGSTKALVDANGVVLSRGAYAAWGGTYGGPSPATPLGWQGRWGVYTDAETGLLLMGLRYYAPCIGRFVSRDPAGLPGGVNPYAYCSCDPVDRADPMGLDDDPSAWSWGQYFSDVGAMFKGYGDTAWGIVRSPVDIYRFYRKHGVSARSTWKLLRAGAVNWWDGLMSGEPRRFAQSFSAGLITVAAAAAPFAEAGEAGAAGAAAEEAGAAGTAATVPERLFVGTPTGETVVIPKGWLSRVADNGRGIVYQRPGAVGNADMIRIMDPTSKFPGGYVRYYNGYGQPLDVLGKPGSQAATHIPLDYTGPIPGWPK